MSDDYKNMLDSINHVEPLPTRPKDPRKAFNYSVTCTLFLPIVGPLIGPSVGYWYLGRKDRAVISSALRLVSMVIGIAGYMQSDPGIKAALVVLGIGGWQALTLYDLISVNG